MSHDSFTSPLERYASEEMRKIWSDDKKFQTWRELWIILAQAQQQLGLAITDEQITEMTAHITDIDYEMAQRLERKIRHDVMAHIHTFGAVAPAAAPIIHLGSTSCYVTDNADLIQIREGLTLLCTRLARVIARLRRFALQHRFLPTLAYTHFQPAQPTTVGKRAVMWLQDVVMDLQALEQVRDNLKFLGAKGATGTQDSFLKLFKGDHAKVKELDRLVAEAAGFSGRLLTVSGQTYTRKQDSRVINVLADFAATAEKIGNDLRLLQSLKELEEPFEKEQVGSSAMAYKRNPMRAERMCALSRDLIGKSPNAHATHGLQWLERTLDDSAARRLFIPESFLLADGIALLLQNICEGIVVYPATIQRHLLAELPFMVTEEILMAMVAQAGANRQECHEKIRQHAHEAGARVKQEGADNDLLDRIRADVYFAPIHGQLDALLDPVRYIGRAPQQVEEYVAEECDPALAPYQDQLDVPSTLSV